MPSRNRTQNIKKIRADLKSLVQEGENMLKDEGTRLSEQGEALRDHLVQSLEAARECCGELEDKAMDHLEEIDQSMHQNPYQYIGIACGIGVLIGLLIGRNR